VSPKWPDSPQKRHSLFGDAPLEPLSVKLLQAAGVLSLLLILVVANALLQSGENPLNPVAAAAERTESVDGLSFRMKVRTTSEAHPPQVDFGNGTLNLETEMALVYYNGLTEDGRRVEVAMVVEGDDAIYLNSPEFRGKLPEGKEWAEMDPSLASDDDSVPAESPDDSLAMLTASDRVHLADHRRLHGTLVSRYVTRFEMGEIAAELRSKGSDQLAEKCEGLASQVVGPVQAEAFVDAKGLLRRIHITMTSTASGAPETIDTRMDFFDFGSHPQIQAPPEDQVFDMTPLLEKQQETLGQSS